MSVSRRDFLRVGGLGVVGLSVGEQAALAEARADANRRSCILLLMTGGASQLETFDPKPGAPAQCRGPLKAVSTALPGIAFSESLPGLAQRAKELAVLRSLYHDAAPIHETGLQLLQTGRLAQRGRGFPDFGAVVARLLGSREESPPWVVLPRRLGSTGVNARRGQETGFLGSEDAPFILAEDEAAAPPEYEEWMESVKGRESHEALRRYGETRFGRLCLRARRLVESGVRVVTVNLFDTLAGQTTWDCHGRKPSSPATLYDYRDYLGPAFDRAVSALLDDLKAQGVLEETLVVAVGEFGRTPRVNAAVGRDHWPGVWSALLAGGGVRGGQVIGASDARGTAPAERPVHPAELVATIYHSLGIAPGASLQPQGGEEYPLVEAEPIAELVG